MLERFKTPERLVNSRMAFVFPGQGSQAVGMGRDLCESSPAARRVFDQADKALGFNISELMFGGTEDDLKITSIAQPAILIASIASLAALNERLGDEMPKAKFMGGHSLGEYTSLVAAGVISFKRGVELVRRRGQLMEEASKQRPGTMAAIIGIDELALEDVCKQTGAYIATVNSDNQIIISGSHANIALAIDLAGARGAKKAIPLSVSGAFHSPLMEPAESRLKAAISNTDFKPPQVPIVANSTGEILRDVGAIKRELIESLCGPVRWKQMVNFMRKQGVGSFLEIGPGRVLSGLIRRIDNEAKTFNVDSPDSIKNLASAMAI